MNSPDPKTLRVDRPVPATAASSLGPSTTEPIGHCQTGTEMAAPRLDGPQHAPSLTKTGSPECEWERGEQTRRCDGSLYQDPSP